MLAMLFLGAIVVRAGFLIDQEAGVARAERRLTNQPDRTADDAPAIGFIPDDDAATPPRTLLADATFLARRDPDAAPAERRADLDRAAAEIAAATRSRPHWGEAWTVRAFIESLRRGRDSPVARQALARSYADAPFLRFAGPWRVRFGLDQWAKLDIETRRHVVREGVWLMRIDSATREPIFAMARQSPGYAPLLLRWRALRAGDADFARDQRPSPEQPGQE